MMLFKEKFLGDRDGAFARQNPKLFDGISKIVTLFEEEQTNIATGFEEIKEQAKMVSVKSILQLRRTQYTAFHSGKKQSRAESQDSGSLPSNQISQLFAVDDTTPPLKEAALVKQGKDQIWRERYFVLRSEGVLYYDNLKQYQRNSAQPKGKILFCVSPAPPVTDQQY